VTVDMCFNRGFYIVNLLFTFISSCNCFVPWAEMNGHFVPSSETWFRLAGMLECYWSLLHCMITGWFSQIVSSKLVCAILPFALNKYKKVWFLYSLLHHAPISDLHFACPRCHGEYFF